jgi:hypothetical protein
VVQGVPQSFGNGTSDDGASSTCKWLEVGGEQAERRWRLPDDTNLDVLEAQIKAAMSSGEPIGVEVLPDAPSTRRTIVLNGRAMPFVVLSEGPLE